MSGHTPAPTSKAFNLAAFQHILSIYPQVLESFYKVKVKGDNSKRREAHEDDTWRYEVFPAELQQREKPGLSKDELERLVRWKITHQTFRPFLLPQIRKNQSDNVETCTRDARRLLFFGQTNTKKSKDFEPSHQRVRHALNKVCELSGVGPATGTLILSVFDNDNVPFFEDELYAWTFPDSKGKLKYNVKEYFDMWSKLKDTLLGTMKTQGGSENAAVDLERIAFVCEHWDHVDHKEKEVITKLLQAEAGQQEGVAKEDEHQQDQDEDDEVNKSPGAEEPSTEKQKPIPNRSKAKRKNMQKEEQFSDTRRSKRLREKA